MVDMTLGGVENNGGPNNEPSPNSRDTEDIASKTSDTSSTLRDAIETGEILTVAYHGGSQPGMQRQIAPIRIEHDLILARCYVSGQVKAFRVNRIEVLENETLISKRVRQ